MVAVLRPLVQADSNFLYSSWIRSFRASSVNAGLPGREYHARQKRRIGVILGRPDTAVIVACDPDDDEHIYGYVVFEMGEVTAMLHYVYVKESFRRFGLGGVLIDLVKRLPREYFCFTHYPPNPEVEHVFRRRGFEFESGVLNR